MTSLQEHTHYILNQRTLLIENFLSTCLQQPTIPLSLKKAMNYSLLSGGKRLRAILCMSTAALFNLSLQAVLPFAAGIEMIHTYSLIHDDLPAMDNDDFRRGKPSCHKAFNEATAILAGDALLTDAFIFMSDVDMKIPPYQILTALHEIAQAVGSSGMVGGQTLDMEYTGATNVSLKTLHTIHQLKTGALFQASCITGPILAGATEYDITALRRYGESLGMAFQIIDDILNETSNTETLGKPTGTDKTMGKVTYPSLLGIERSKQIAQKEIKNAVTNLSLFSGDEVLFLKGIAEMIILRTQ